jgi:hypothetical protein
MRIKDKSNLLPGSHTLECVGRKGGGAIITIDGSGCSGAYVEISHTDVTHLVRQLESGNVRKQAAEGAVPIEVQQ